MKRILVLISIIGLLAGTTVWADSLTIPHTFQSGQKAMAGEVNDNFNAVATEVTDNAGDIAVNTQDITNNATAITVNSNSITNVAGQLSGHSHSSPSSTQYISFSFVAGVDRNEKRTSKAENTWDISEPDQFANADTTVWWYGRTAAYMYTDGRKSPVYLPVQLPHGAEVVEFGILYYDEAPGDPAMVSYMQRTLGDSSGLFLATVRPSVVSVLPQYAWTTTINPNTAVIDNTSYSYHIRANLYAGRPMAVLSAFVGYVMP